MMQERDALAARDDGGSSNSAANDVDDADVATQRRPMAEPAPGPVSSTFDREPVEPAPAEPMPAEPEPVEPEPVEPEPRVSTREALTTRVGVRALVAAFDEAERVVRASFACIVRAEERVNAVFALGERGTIRVDASYDGYHGGDFDQPDRCVERMRRAAWGCIVDRLELRRVMAVQAWEELNTELEKGPVPAVTEENVTRFVSRYATDLPAIFQTKVAEVFNWIRPHKGYSGSELKTNQRNARLEIGPKVILTGVVERWVGTYHVRHWQEQRFTALESIFCMLDGQGWGTRTHHGELTDAIGKTKWKGDGRGATQFFRFRCCMNGNLHLEFLRLDLLKRFNEIAGGLTLRPKGE